MLCCYIDESTAFGEKDPATCVAGYVATGKQWAKFSGAWNYLLRHYKVEIFHAKEFETEEGRRHSVYKRWSKKKRNEFQNGIIDIINGSGLKDLGAAIPASVYKAVMTQERIRTFGKTPDAVCALLCMLSAGGFAWAQEGVYKQAPSFIVEAGGNYGHMLRRVHKYLITESEYRDFYSLSTLTFAPKSKAYPQLQAADYLAFNMSKRASHVVDLNPPRNAITETLSDGTRVRRTRYPLFRLYEEHGPNVWHFPTVKDLEKMIRSLETEDAKPGKLADSKLPIQKRQEIQD